MRITALAGGVGAAKFLRGLVKATDPSHVTIIGNIGDDTVMHGLHISPDLDIVTYTLAGVVADSGWGIRGDTAAALGQMRRLGIDAWFTLNDTDLGTHLARTTWMSEGATLAEVTERISRSLGVTARILPATNDPVRTRIITAGGVEREFQEYFVKFHHAEEVSEVKFDGASGAAAAPGVIEAIAEADRVIICPSNPVISIGPILAIPGIREAVANRRTSTFAISPIVAGAALKGPADRLIPLLGAEVSPTGIATIYRDIAANFVIDARDAGHESRIAEMGLRAIVTDTVMSDEHVSRRLAETILSA